jgi:hypothetical protein
MSRAERLLIALASACAAAAIGYAAVRVAETAFFPEPNPAVVIWSERSGFVWRSAIALYIGGASAFGGYALAARSPEVAARWIARAVLIAAIALLAQGALLP